MKTSKDGIRFLTGYEKLRLKAYKPTPNDVWTIGYGSTLGVYEGMVITKEEADQFLVRDLEAVERCINNNVTTELEQYEFDALVSFVYNVGCTSFKNSTLLRLLNEGDKWAAANQLLRWNKQGKDILAGLTRRRTDEKMMFLDGGIA